MPSPTTTQDRIKRLQAIQDERRFATGIETTDPYKKEKEGGIGLGAVILGTAGIWTFFTAGVGFAGALVTMLPFAGAAVGIVLLCKSLFGKGQNSQDQALDQELQNLKAKAALEETGRGGKITAEAGKAQEDLDFVTSKVNRECNLSLTPGQLVKLIEAEHHMKARNIAVPEQLTAVIAACEVKNIPGDGGYTRKTDAASLFEQNSQSRSIPPGLQAGLDAAHAAKHAIDTTRPNSLPGVRVEESELFMDAVTNYAGITSSTNQQALGVKRSGAVQMINEAAEFKANAEIERRRGDLSGALGAAVGHGADVGGGPVR